MKKRTKYRPRPMLTDPLSVLRPVRQSERDRLSALFLSAIAAMKCGTDPGPEEWRALSDAINTVETLCLSQGKLVASEVMPTVNAAIAGMVRAKNRYQAGKGMRLDAEGIQALRDIIDIYVQCMEGLTEREMERAQQETQRRVHALLNARAPSGAVVEML